MPFTKTFGLWWQIGLVRPTVVGRTLVCLTVLLSLAAPALWSTPAEAHNFEPATIDISFDGHQVHLEIAISVEAVLADLDLRYLDDQGDKEKAARYDVLRLATPAQLKAEFLKAWPYVASQIHVAVEGKHVPVQFDEILIPEGGQPDKPRIAKLDISAPLPPGTDPITFSWASSLGPVLLRRTIDGQSAYADMLLAGTTSKPFKRGAFTVPTNWETFTRYLGLGFEHIIPKGLDHILFVIGLFFYSKELKTLLFQVTAFTVAHSITLALSTLGLFSVPSSFVEPLIAASIVYVAVENTWGKRNSRWRLFVVFGFGLLHGLGFASVLSEYGLGHLDFAMALGGFNLGVEAGQIAVLALAYLGVGYWFGDRLWYRSGICIPASFLIGVIGLYWFFERL